MARVERSLIIAVEPDDGVFDLYLSQLEGQPVICDLFRFRILQEAMEALDHPSVSGLIIADAARQSRLEEWRPTDTTSPSSANSAPFSGPAMATSLGVIQA